MVPKEPTNNTGWKHLQIQMGRLCPDHIPRDENPVPNPELQPPILTPNSNPDF